MDRDQNPLRARGQPRLVDQVGDVVGRLRCSVRIEQCDVDWIRRFILSHGKRRPADREAMEVEALLTFIAFEGNVASSTKNHAPNGIVFLYRQILRKRFGWLDGIEPAKKPASLPVVLTRDEERAVLARLDGSDP